MQQKILIIEDDLNIAELIKLYLNKEGYHTEICTNGKDSLSFFSQFSPNLILLDIMLPGMNGYDICREIRKQSSVPIIMLTAKNETFDKVLGLELGADDYIVKPFDSKELVARIKAVLRRYQKDVKSEISNEIIYPDLKICPSDYSLIYKNNRMEIPPKEFELLSFLAKNPNQVFTREQLLDHVWGYDYYGETRTVDVHIKRLREKFQEQTSWQIKTVWSVGYKFSTD